MIYCVEDDDAIRELIVYALRSSGLEARGFTDGGGFFPALAEELPELALLDVMLPGEDGLRILRRLREDERTRGLPVLLLTAKSAEFDKVLGLDSGADDYITKPFGVMEMIARVKAALRRAGQEKAKMEKPLRFASLTLYPEQHRVLAAGQETRLTFKEFALLQYLLANVGLALSRDQILTAVWGYDFEGETRTVDMHIKTLRQKLGPPGELIETIRGIGYKIGGRYE
ncbi:MAG: response regulator transcription factor [Peptococcaceae bacterium]|jgi:two-component system alkaline phosphatase synthesis response regulator PhoP|nr:response regulator transcription factor [Peptococcaceae bacterium]